MVKEIHSCLTIQSGNLNKWHKKLNNLQYKSVSCGNKDFWQVTYFNNDFSNKIAFSRGRHWRQSLLCVFMNGQIQNVNKGIVKRFLIGTSRWVIGLLADLSGAGYSNACITTGKNFATMDPHPRAALWRSFASYSNHIFSH